MDPTAPPTETTVLLECGEGVEREEIFNALETPRETWINQTQGDYWSDIPAAERRNIAGRLWDRIHRLADRL